MNAATIEYPNNLTAAEYHELLAGSAIHPALIKRNFFHIEGESVYDYLFISDKIPRKNAGRVTDGYIKMYQHLLLGGTWIQSLDPFKNWQPMEWGRLKPNFPRFDWEKGKPVKYESPPKTANRVTYFDVPNYILNLVARRYNVSDIAQVLFAKRGKKLCVKSRKKGIRNGTLLPWLLQVGQTTAILTQIAQLSYLLALCIKGILNPLIFWSGVKQQKQNNIDFQQKDLQITFWEWVKQHPEIPIILCEGEKKAACLLSLGFVAIALPGIWNGRVGKQDFDERLHPDLVPMAQAGRKFIILFDYETKAKTRWSVFQATVRTAKTIEAVGCECEVALLPGPEKGVDDFVVGRGVDANTLLTAIIDDAKSLADYQRSYRAKKWGLSKYKPDVTVNIKYLTQALCIPDLEEKCSSPPALYDLGLEKLFSPNLIATGCDLDTGFRENVELKDSSSFNAKPSTQNPKKSFRFPEKGLVVLWSDMGTGKTELMRWWRDQNPDAR
ncbi:DUF3854 domain-containing protein, partial [Nostoc sp. NMS8]|uniref:DUF3854 domain-containing protein n=1 Tax=Nostoc sp. NMS8 TaxID=2815392 RepID=UPI0025D783E7